MFCGEGFDNGKEYIYNHSVSNIKHMESNNLDSKESFYSVCLKIVIFKFKLTEDSRDLLS